MKFRSLQYLKRLSFLTFMLFSFSCNADSKVKKQPNIIVFLVDDMGWQETSIPFHTQRTALNDSFKTPNMERLANQGMIFTQAYASAVCSPSRVSLITGTNPARHGITCWTLHKDKSPERFQGDLIPAHWNMNGLTRDENIDKTFQWDKTLPVVLRDAGYYTIHVGKAHFGAHGTPGADPIHIGFDQNIAGHAAGGPGSYHGDKNFSAVWRNGMDIWDVPHLEKYHGQDINLTEALTIEANKAIEDATAKGKPFFLHMSHYAVHGPWEADRRFVQKYLDTGLEERLANHASMIESMDKSLGDMMDKLKDLGIEDETIIVFISDNGSPRQLTPNRPLRGHKITPYEGGVRVPMIVKWPGITKKTSRNNHPVIIQDIYASLIDWAKAERYALITHDSQSFVPLVKGKKPQDVNRSLIWHYPNYYDVKPFSIIRMNNMKLIHYYHDGHNELYDLSNDISEKNDLAMIEKEVVNKMVVELKSYLREVNAPMPYNQETKKLITW
ncbi:MAG: sulfatase [Carboxylicivirga sp.]|nr:sulfatase [Carboxylicivirga sp.]